MKTTLHLTQDIKECLIQFRNAVFSHNRDNQTKNFSFLMNAQDQWKISSAYDLTFLDPPPENILAS